MKINIFTKWLLNKNFRISMFIPWILDQNMSGKKAKQYQSQKMAAIVPIVTHIAAPSILVFNRHLLCHLQNLSLWWDCPVTERWNPIREEIRKPETLEHDMKSNRKGYDTNHTENLTGKSGSGNHLLPYFDPIIILRERRWWWIGMLIDRNTDCDANKLKKIMDNRNVGNEREN